MLAMEPAIAAGSSIGASNNSDKDRGGRPQHPVHVHFTVSNANKVHNRTAACACNYCDPFDPNSEDPSKRAPKQPIKGVEVLPVSRVSEAVALLKDIAGS
jgi:hypothetical protein